MGSAKKSSKRSRAGFSGIRVPWGIAGFLLLMGCETLHLGYGDPDHPFRRSGGDALSLSTSHGDEGPALVHVPVSALPPIRETQPTRPDWNVRWKLPAPVEVEPERRIRPLEEEPGEREERHATPLETSALSPEDVAWCRLLVTLIFEDDESPSKLPDAPGTRVLPVSTELARD